MAGELFINAKFANPEDGKSLILIREDGAKGKGTFSGSGYGVSWEDGGSGSVKGWRYAEMKKKVQKRGKKNESERSGSDGDVHQDSGEGGKE